MLREAREHIRRVASTAATNNIYLNTSYYYGPWNLSTSISSSNSSSWLSNYEPTPAEQAASAERERKRKVATIVAEQLWLAHLSEMQRRTWDQHGYVDVLAPSGRRYRLKNYHAHNVFQVDALGRELRKYCAYANDPGGMLPLGDHLFTQMVTLQFGEREFLAKANTWDMLREGHPFVGQGVDAVFADAKDQEAA